MHFFNIIKDNFNLKNRSVLYKMFHKIFTIISLFILSVNAGSMQFSDFIRQHNKQYSDDE